MGEAKQRSQTVDAVLGEIATDLKAKPDSPRWVAVIDRAGEFLAARMCSQVGVQSALSLLRSPASLHRSVPVPVVREAAVAVANLQRITCPLFEYGSGPGVLQRRSADFASLADGRSQEQRKRLARDICDAVDGELPSDYSQVEDAALGDAWEIAERGWIVLPLAGKAATSRLGEAAFTALNAGAQDSSSALAQGRMLHRAIAAALVRGDTEQAFSWCSASVPIELKDDQRLLEAAALMDLRRYAGVEEILSTGSFRSGTIFARAARACLFMRQQRDREALAELDNVVEDESVDFPLMVVWASGWSARVAERMGDDRGHDERLGRTGTILARVSGGYPGYVVGDELRRARIPWPERTEPAEPVMPDGLATLYEAAKEVSSDAERISKHAKEVVPRAAVWVLMAASSRPSFRKEQGLEKARSLYEVARSVARSDLLLLAWLENEWAGLLMSHGRDAEISEVRTCLEWASNNSNRLADPVTWADIAANHGEFSANETMVREAIDEHIHQGRFRNAARARWRLATLLKRRKDPRAPGVARRAARTSALHGDFAGVATHLMLWQECSTSWDGELVAAALAAAFNSGEQRRFDMLWEQASALYRDERERGFNLEAFDAALDGLSLQEARSTGQMARVESLLVVGRSRLAREFPEFSYALDWKPAS